MLQALGTSIWTAVAYTVRPAQLKLRRSPADCRGQNVAVFGRVALQEADRRGQNVAVCGRVALQEVMDDPNAPDIAQPVPQSILAATSAHVSMPCSHSSSRARP